MYSALCVVIASGTCTQVKLRTASNVVWPSSQLAMQVDFASKVVRVAVPTGPGQHLEVSVSREPEQGGAAAAAAAEVAATTACTYRCRLLVGADGLNSRVREALQDAQPASGWELRGKPAWSSGMRFKVRAACVHSSPRPRVRAQQRR